MKRKEEKGSRDFPWFRWKTAGRWCRSCPVGTCSPLARVLRAHTPTTNCTLGAAGSLSSTSSRLSERFSSTSDPQRVRSHVHLAHTLCPHTLRSLLRFRPLFGTSHSLSANRGRTRLLPSSPSQVITPGEKPRGCCCIGTQPTRNVLPLLSP